MDARISASCASGAPRAAARSRSFFNFLISPVLLRPPPLLPRADDGFAGTGRSGAATGVAATDAFHFHNIYEVYLDFAKRAY